MVFLLPILLSLFNLMGVKSFNTIILLSMIIVSLISGLILGRNVSSKGYIHGLALGLTLIGILFLLSLFSKESLEVSSLIYYLLILVTCTLGSMLGIQKKVSE